MNLSVLIHTFNGYDHLWNGQAVSFQKNWPWRGTDIYFGTDTPRADYPWHAGDIIYYGPGEWSDCLRALHAQIPTDYVLYMQEDHWPTKPPPDLAELMRIVTENDIFRLQISPIVPFYTLFSEGNTLFFDVKSKYLVSHQPSIWKKSFLLECLKPGENPWKNEYEGTKRLNNRPEIEGKIAIYPYEWYSHKCIKGKIVD